MSPKKSRHSRRTRRTRERTDTASVGEKAGPLPIKSWAFPLEDGALEQATNLSNLPFAIDHVALMPDAHKGYGMPIGGVLFAERAVVPYAIGVDIGCGVALAETDLTVESLKPDELEHVLEAIVAGVPTGFATLDVPVDREDAEAAMGVSKPPSVRAAWFERARQPARDPGMRQPLPGDPAGRGRERVFVMLHSGSRSLGKTICDEFHKRALAQNRAWHSVLPHDELAFLPVGSEDYVGHWAAMDFCPPVRRKANRSRTRCRGGRVRGAHEDRAVRSTRWTSTTTTPPGKTTRVGTASSTGRAPCGPGPERSS